MNRRYEELFHVSREKVLGRTDHDIFPTELASRFQENDRAVLAARKPVDMEEYAPHDDGIHSYISIKFPLEGPDGSITGVCGIATDITERKQLEAAGRHLAAIVESSERRHHQQGFERDHHELEHGRRAHFRLHRRRSRGQTRLDPDRAGPPR